MASAPSEAWSDNDKRQFESLIAQFEQAWHTGAPPNISDFLPATGRIRNRLFNELVAIDREFRRARKLSDNEQEYRRLVELLRTNVANADRNLLFGILALQLDFITREQLIAAMSTWAVAKNQPLASILQEQGALSLSNRALLEPLVAAHIRKHNDDPQQSVAALSSISSVAEDLAKIPDKELHATLTHASTRSQPSGVEKTLSEQPAKGTRFRVVRPHAKGGLGVVFVARDQELNREVALKEIQQLYASDEVARARFTLEAEITGSLEHPGIVPVYGLGSYEDGRPFYAMRFIRGDSLKEAIERYHQPKSARKLVTTERTLELRQLLGRFVDVCQAVAYAHSRGVLHRDLKPGNIMLGKYGETLVVDWGVAKALGQSDPEASPVSEGAFQPASGSSVDPTQQGTVVGTLAYMSPEQANGRLDTVGTGTDVFSLGATLFHILTGQPPYYGVPGEELRGRIRDGCFPSPRQIRKDIPASLEAICLKAMAHVPSDRYATAGELADDIEHFLADEPTHAYRDNLWERAQRWLRRHRGAALSGIVGLAMISLISAVSVVLIYLEKAQVEKQRGIAQGLATRNEQMAQEERLRYFQAATDQGVRLMDEGNFQEALLWFVTALDRNPPNHPDTTQRVRIQSLLTSCPDLRGVSRHRNVITKIEVSPDQRLLATASRDGTARVWDAVTGKPVTPPLAHKRAVDLAKFSPDGTLVATADSLDLVIHIWRIADGVLVTSLPLTEPAYKFWFLSSEQVVTLHDASGRLRRWRLADQANEELLVDAGEVIDVDDRLKYAALRTTEGVRVLEIESRREVVPETKIKSRGYLPRTFSSDGGYFAIGNQNTINVFSTATGQSLGSIVIADEKPLLSGIKFSPLGDWLGAKVASNVLLLKNVVTGKTQRIESPADISFFWSFSPDGQHLATACADANVRIWHVASGRLIAPTIPQRDLAGDVAFTADGFRLHTVSFDKLLTWNIGLVLQTSRVEERPFEEMNGPGDASWANSRFAVRNGANKVRLFTLGEESEFPVLTHEAEVTDIKLSPNGKLVACRTSDNRLHVWNGESGTAQRQNIEGVAEKCLFAVGDDGVAIVRKGEPRQNEDTTLEILVPSEDRREFRLVGAEAETAALLPDNRLLTWPVNLVSQFNPRRAPRLWDLATGQAVGPPFPVATMPRIVLNRARSLVAISSELLLIQIFSLRDGSPAGECRLEDSPVTNMAFSNDGTQLAGFCEDGNILIWNLLTNERRKTSQPLPSNIGYLVFSNSGQYLVSGTRKYIRIWETVSGDPVTPPFRSSGLSLLNRAEDRVLTLFSAPDGIQFDARPFLPEQSTIDSLRARAETLSLLKINSRGQREPLNDSELEKMLNQGK